MRKILLSLALLTTVTSEDFDTKKHRPLLSEGEPQFWFARGSRFPWDLTHFEFDQSSKDKDVRRLQTTESSLNKISTHDLNRFGFNNPNFANPQQERSSLDNHQRIDESSVTEKKKQNFLMSQILPNFPLNQEMTDCTLKKCPSYFQNWRLIEPFYVDEPKWVQIKAENYDTRFDNNEPFFVTRGKRSLKLNLQKQFTKTIPNDNDFTRVNKSTKIQKRNTKDRQIIQEIVNETNDEKIKRNKSMNLEKKIIQKRSENENEKQLLANLEKSLNLNGGTGKSFNYLHPRNKHSDILEILDEPFFISRGKKNDNYYYYHPIRDFSVPGDYLWEQYLNQRLDNFLSDLKNDDINLPEIDLSDKQRILAKIFNNNNNNNIPRKRTQNDDRKIYESNTKRNILDEINMQLDPFYIARG